MFFYFSQGREKLLEHKSFIRTNQHVNTKRCTRTLDSHARLYARTLAIRERESVICGNIGYTGKCPLYTETSDIPSTRTQVAAISEVSVTPDTGYTVHQRSCPQGGRYNRSLLYFLLW